MSEGNYDRGRSRLMITLFGTPITIRGFSWLPITQLVTWGVIMNSSDKSNPEISFRRRVGESALHMLTLLGLEWCHNLSHAFAAWLIGKPMDEMRIQFGIPRCRYYDLHDQNVTPQEHLVRAAGGPLFNLLALPLSLLLQHQSKPASTLKKVSHTAVGTNVFLGLVSLLPIPGIDGGPILKWGLVSRGHSIERADKIVQRVNGPLALLLGGVGVGALSRGKKWMGIFCSLLGITAFGIFSGLLKEEAVKL